MDELFRTPDERFGALPGYDFEPHWHDADGLRMHYLDEGAGDPVVCFHGEPTWAYLYRKMLPPLTSAGLRVVVPDYAGFGRSDKPTDRRWYSYDRHVEYTAALLGALDLRDATVVVQDWGGPIGLRWAVENAERVARLVILNTGLFTGRVSKGFMAWRDFTERTPICRSASCSRAGRRQSSRTRCSPPTRRPSRRPSRRPAQPSSRCSCLPLTTSQARPRCAR
jgi:haloalkane dehalogenase